MVDLILHEPKNLAFKKYDGLLFSGNFLEKRREQIGGLPSFAKTDAWVL